MEFQKLIPRRASEVSYLDYLVTVQNTQCGHSGERPAG